MEVQSFNCNDEYWQLPLDLPTDILTVTVDVALAICH